MPRKTPSQGAQQLRQCKRAKVLLQVLIHNHYPELRRMQNKDSVLHTLGRAGFQFDTHAQIDAWVEADRKWTRPEPFQTAQDVLHECYNYQKEARFPSDHVVEAPTHEMFPRSLMEILEPIGNASASVAASRTQLSTPRAQGNIHLPRSPIARPGPADNPIPRPMNHPIPRQRAGINMHMASPSSVLPQSPSAPRPTNPTRVKKNARKIEQADQLKKNLADLKQQEIKQLGAVLFEGMGALGKAWGFERTSRSKSRSRSFSRSRSRSKSPKTASSRFLSIIDKLNMPSVHGEGVHSHLVNLEVSHDKVYQCVQRHTLSMHKNGAAPEQIKTFLTKMISKYCD